MASFFGWTIAALVAATATLFLIGPDRLWRTLAGDPDTGRIALEALECTGRPNDALIAPTGWAPFEPDGEPPVFDEPADQLFDRLVAIMAEEPGAVWAERDEAGLYARLITFSPLLKFPDVNHVWVLPAEDGASSTLALYAAAQLGHSDMGKNKERLEGWLARLTASQEGT